MRFADGSLGSAVTSNGCIIGQSGFVPVPPVAIAPVLIFQALVVITGQHYLKQINKRLKSIEERLGELIGLFHNEKITKLKHHYERLSYLSQKNIAHQEDLNEIISLSNDIGAISYEYRELIQNISESTESMVDGKLQDYFFETAGQHLSSLEQSLNNSHAKLKFSTAIKANELNLIAKTVKLKLL